MRNKQNSFDLEEKARSEAARTGVLVGFRPPTYLLTVLDKIRDRPEDSTTTL